MGKNRLKIIFIALISILTLLISSAYALENYESNNVLNNVKLKKVGENKLEVQLFAEKKFPTKPLQFEKSKNTYFISLPGTKYEGERDFDISNVTDDVKALTVDFIPYQTAKSDRYTRIIIRTTKKMELSVTEKTGFSFSTYQTPLYALGSIILICIFIYISFTIYVKISHRRKNPDLLIDDYEDISPKENDEQQIEDITALAAEEQTFISEPETVITENSTNPDTDESNPETVEPPQEDELNSEPSFEDNTVLDIIENTSESEENIIEETNSNQNFTSIENKEREDNIADTPEEYANTQTDNQEYHNTEDTIKEENPEIEETISAPSADEMVNDILNDESVINEISDEIYENNREEISNYTEEKSNDFETISDLDILEELNESQQENTDNIDLPSSDQMQDYKSTAIPKASAGVVFMGTSFDLTSAIKQNVQEEPPDEQTETEETELSAFDTFGFTGIVGDMPTEEEIQPLEEIEYLPADDTSVFDETPTDETSIMSDIEIQPEENNPNHTEQQEQAFLEEEKTQNNNINDEQFSTEQESQNEIPEAQSLEQTSEEKEQEEIIIEETNDNTEKSETSDEVITNDFYIAEETQDASSVKQYFEEEQEEDDDENQPDIVFSRQINTDSFFAENVSDNEYEKENNEEFSTENYDTAVFFYKDDLENNSDENQDNETENINLEDFIETKTPTPKEEADEKIDDSEPIVLDRKEFSNGKLLYLIRHNGEYSLVATANENVFVIERFSQKPQKEEIILKLNEQKHDKDVWLTKVGTWRALIGVSDDKIENILTL